jgi:hypothetical protein
MVIVQGFSPVKKIDGDTGLLDLRRIIPPRTNDLLWIT